MKNDSRIMVHGYVSTEELDKAIKNADVFLSIDSKFKPNSIPSKVFRFFDSNMPIIHFSHEKNIFVEEYMEKVSELTGREYHPFTYYGAPDADRMIIAMGSLCDATKETVDYLNAHGEKTGLLSVHLYRPFSLKYFFKYINWFFWRSFSFWFYYKKYSIFKFIKFF